MMPQTAIPTFLQPRTAGFRHLRDNQRKQQWNESLKHALESSWHMVERYRLRAPPPPINTMLQNGTKLLNTNLAGDTAA